MTRCLPALALALAMMPAAAVPAAAQGRERPLRPNAQAGAALEDAGVTPAEIQRMFDSYALMQAQEQLKISDDQFPKFLPRFKALQDVRRQGLMQRTRVLNVLRQTLNAPQPPDEGQLRDHLKQLDEIETRTNAEAKKALDAIDQVLDVRQQAKFRVFEENMERRKLELVTRARQANRPKNQQQ
jgi:hypothetical protein